MISRRGIGWWGGRRGGGGLDLWDRGTVVWRVLEVAVPGFWMKGCCRRGEGPRWRPLYCFTPADSASASEGRMIREQRRDLDRPACYLPVEVEESTDSPPPKPKQSLKNSPPLCAELCGLKHNLSIFLSCFPSCQHRYLKGGKSGERGLALWGGWVWRLGACGRGGEGFDGADGADGADGEGGGLRGGEGVG